MGARISWQAKIGRPGVGIVVLGVAACLIALAGITARGQTAATIVDEWATVQRPQPDRSN